MLPVGECRELVIWVREGPRLALGAILSWRESLATLAIGTLSTTLGVAALAALAVRHPRFDLVYAAFVGHWLGIGGIFLALRIGRGMSLLSLLGTAMCLVVVGPIYALATLGLLGIAAWMVLSVWAVAQCYASSADSRTTSRRGLNASHTAPRDGRDRAIVWATPRHPPARIGGSSRRLSPRQAMRLRGTPAPRRGRGTRRG